MKISHISTILVMITSTVVEITMAEDVFDATATRAYSIPNADAPQLAALGPYKVGVREIVFTDPARPSIVEAISGQPPMKARDIPVTLWYPARTDAEGPSAVYSGELPFRPGARPDDVPKTYRFSGIAISDAAMADAERYPLVILSHGYGNWATFLSYLGENLASKGYVVASIDHRDLPYTDLPTFNLSFGETMLNRSRDQRFVIASLVDMATTSKGIGEIIDGGSVGLIGYSMGGFGALTTAGAGYDPKSPSLNQIPAPMLTGIIADEHFMPPPSQLKAVVAVSPWGAAPANRAWNAQALGNIKTPLLFLAGDKDDVSGYEDGIKWIYDNASGSNRHMLVYQNGRHSIGGNPEPPIAADYFDLTDWFNEPVWRRDRIVGINQHFITAFLNLHLKGDSGAGAFLAVTPQNSNDGEWPLPPGGYVGGTYSSGLHDGKSYWKGFQRRYAVGLQMFRAGAGE